MKRKILGVVIGSVVGGIAFYPLATTISLTIMLNMGFDSYSSNLGMMEALFWLVPITGVIIGGLIGIYVGKNKPSFVPFKNTSLTIIFWFVVLFGILGLETGFMFSGVTLIGLGNTSTAIDLWIFSFMGAIVGVIIGVLMGFLIVLIRLAIIKFRTSNNYMKSFF